MIESTYFWTIVVCLALGTLLIRGSIIALSAKVKISGRVRELFTYIPAAILPAFIAPAVFFHNGHVTWVMGKERLMVLILSALVCILTKSTVTTILFGLILLYLVTQGL